MGCGRCCLIGLGLYAVVLAYYLYNPIPEGIEESWKYQLVLGFMKFSGHLIYAMGCGRCCLIGLGLYAVVLAYYLYNPIPEGIEESWKYQLVLGFMKFSGHLANVYEYFGGDWRVAMRKVGAPAELFMKLNSDEHLKITNEIFDGVPVRLYNPQPSKPNRPALIYVHGGGWYTGSPGLYDQLCGYLAKKMNIVIASVDYRFEPSPVPLQDVETVTRHLMVNSNKFDVDLFNLGIAGDSAGGNMAAALSMKFRDHGTIPQFKFQVLIYPALQAFDMVEVPSHKLNMWHAVNMLDKKGLALAFLGYMGIDPKYKELFLENKHISQDTRLKYHHLVDWSKLPKQYIPNGYKAKEPPVTDPELVTIAESHVLNPHNWPLMAENLASLPPAYIVTVQHDTLRDDGLLYHVRLQENGVESNLYHVENGWHMMIMYAGGPFRLAMVQRLLDDMSIFMGKHYGIET